MKKENRQVIKSNKKKVMCKEGSIAYDGFINKGNNPQQANKLASRVCKDLGDKATIPDASIPSGMEKLG